MEKPKLIYSKLFIFVVAILVLSVGVIAFYNFSYDNEVVYEIVGSKKDLKIQLDLTNIVLNVSENLSITQDLNLINQNGNAVMDYIENISIINLDPGNCTINNDISFELFKDGLGVINDGENFTMNPGMNIFNLTATAINNRVCPQNITISLGFSEI